MQFGCSLHIFLQKHLTSLPVLKDVTDISLLCPVFHWRCCAKIWRDRLCLGRFMAVSPKESAWLFIWISMINPQLCIQCFNACLPFSICRAGLLSAPVHCEDAPFSTGQPQHCPSRQALWSLWRAQQRCVE